MACIDVSAAEWVVGSARHWARLVTFGPEGFAGYARLRHLPDPAYDGQRLNPRDIDGTWWDGRDQLGTLLRVLGAHTTTPDDCYVCVWEGYTVNEQDPPPGFHELRDIHGGLPPAYPAEHTPGYAPRPAPFVQPGVDPAAPPTRAPVVIPNRAYFLFHGPLADALDWNDMRLSWGDIVLEPHHPAFLWPADRAWCVAADVDPHWTGIGASAEVIAELTRDARLDVVPADPDAGYPEYR